MKWQSIAGTNIIAGKDYLFWSKSKKDWFRGYYNSGKDDYYSYDGKIIPDVTHVMNIRKPYGA